MDVQDLGTALQEVGREWGTTTGRRRRCGWLDLVVMKHSCLVNGYDSLNLTKLDVLDGFEEIKVGTKYLVEGKALESFPADLDLLAMVSVEYVTLPGWKMSIAKMSSYGELPEACKQYIEFIEREVNVKIKWIGTGPGRDNMIAK